MIEEYDCIDFIHRIILTIETWLKNQKDYLIDTSMFE